jgi:hypothetical protein
LLLADALHAVLVSRLQIKPHPHFMLFATQNPPGAYGGRKVRLCNRPTRAACSAPQWMQLFSGLAQRKFLPAVRHIYESQNR